MYSAPLKSLLLLTVPSSGRPRNDIWLKRLSTDAGQMCVECNWETIESHLSELDGQQIQLFFHAECLFIGEKEVVACGIQLGWFTAHVWYQQSPQQSRQASVLPTAYKIIEASCWQAAASNHRVSEALSFWFSHRLTRERSSSCGDQIWAEFYIGLWFLHADIMQTPSGQIWWLYLCVCVCVYVREKRHDWNCLLAQFGIQMALVEATGDN